ncbi:MAG: hypothetical protein ACJA01_002330 [Saprospiraceae bacterium]|jgi:hypothetical protein
MLYYIDISKAEYVPLTFVKAKDWERQQLRMTIAHMTKPITDNPMKSLKSE